MAKHRRLLVAQDGADRHTGKRTALTHGTEITQGRANLRQHGHRDAHFLTQFLIPLQLFDVHKQGAGGVGDVGGVQRFAAGIALGAAGEVPQQPAIDGAEEQVACLSTLAGTFDVIEDPLHLRSRRVGVDEKSGAAAPLFWSFLTREFLTDSGGTGVLPDNGVVDRLTGVLIPHHGGLTLVGDTYRVNVFHGDVAIGKSLTDGATGIAPDFFRIVFYPAFFREDLLVLELANGSLLAVVVKDDAARRRGSLVDSGDVFLVSHVSSLLYEDGIRAQRTTGQRLRPRPMGPR